MCIGRPWPNCWNYWAPLLSILQELWYKPGIPILKEMSMPVRSRPHQANQPGLFSPVPVRPTWQSLPPETQQQLLGLLARMFRSVWQACELQAPSTEVSDE